MDYNCCMLDKLTFLLAFSIFFAIGGALAWALL